MPSQPTEALDPVEDLTDSEFVSLTVPDADQVDTRESIQLRYATYKTPDSEEYENPRDNLYDDRLVSIDSADGRNWAYTVTTEIQSGDCFRFEYREGTWRFVGVHPLYDAVMLFEPASPLAHENDPVGAYCTKYRGDFARKFCASLNPDIERIDPSEDE